MNLSEQRKSYYLFIMMLNTLFKQMQSFPTHNIRTTINAFTHRLEHMQRVTV